MSKITKEQAKTALAEVIDEAFGHYDFMLEIGDAVVDEDGKNGYVTVKFRFYEYEDEPQFISF